ncbi:radical SAM protein [Fusobacterium varium]|nr:radical SAM protein [Fusobacterium varium]
MKKVVKILQNISYNIVIHRLTGDGNRDTLIAPLWSLNKRDVLNSIEKEMKMENIYQGGTEI